MTSVTLWLLVSLTSGTYAGTPNQVVERFLTLEHCQQVATVINARTVKVPVQCIQATIAIQKVKE